MIALMAMCLVPQALASAMLTLTGKIISFDSKTVVLEVRKKLLYTLDRTQLEKGQSAHITRSEVQATLAVPMEAVKSVTEVKKSKQ